MGLNYLIKYDFDKTYQGDFLEAKIIQNKLKNLKSLLPIFFDKTLYILKDKNSILGYVFKSKKSYIYLSKEQFSDVILHNLSSFFQRLDYRDYVEFPSIISINQNENFYNINDLNGLNIVELKSKSTIKCANFYILKCSFKSFIKQKIKEYSEQLLPYIKKSKDIHSKESSVVYNDKMFSWLHISVEEKSYHNSTLYYRKFGKVLYDSCWNRQLLNTDRLHCEDKSFKNSFELVLFNKSSLGNTIKISYKNEISVDDFLLLTSKNSEKFLNIFNNLPFLVNSLHQEVLRYNSNNIGFINPLVKYNDRFLTVFSNKYPVQHLTSKIFVSDTTKRISMYDLVLEFAGNVVINFDLKPISNKDFFNKNYKKELHNEKIKNIVSHF